MLGEAMFESDTKTAKIILKHIYNQYKSILMIWESNIKQ